MCVLFPIRYVIDRRKIMIWHDKVEIYFLFYVFSLFQRNQKNSTVESQNKENYIRYHKSFLAFILNTLAAFIILKKDGQFE